MNFPAWYAALPVAVSAAGVLFTDEASRVLLVRTTYKEDWDIPGGVIEVDGGETPAAAARRELFEELGLDRPVGDLLSIDVQPPRPNRRAFVAFLFDGGTLTADDLAGIRFQDGEIAEVRFVALDELAGFTDPALARRIGATLRHPGSGPLFLSDGEPTGNDRGHGPHDRPDRAERPVR
ncbi:NUDIX domain-containing protein [Herbidospora mongoliensis]|uniref:NUDIX domain-containing protein n=1 Tax=Herbidospora mongoliensis TaxID=688067 RepID=UPI00082D7772|nr:NUDIX hydrolase [Herbidospora mongoliensis]